jgi:hypothetical protein
MSLRQRPTETFLPPFSLYGQFSSSPRAPELIFPRNVATSREDAFDPRSHFRFFPFYRTVWRSLACQDYPMMRYRFGGEMTT